MVPDPRSSNENASLTRRRLLGLTTSAAGAALGGCLSSVRDDPSGSDDSVRSGAADARGEVSIELPDEARLDERVHPQITGLGPSECVRLEYLAGQPQGGREWRGSATFEADEDGGVDLAEAAPIEGSYDRVDAMGPFWSMRSDEPAHRAWFGPGTHDVEFTVRPAGCADGRDDGADAVIGDADASSSDSDGPADDGTALATATTTRLAPDASTEPLGDDLVGRFHVPDGEEPAPAVLVLHGSGGSELGHVSQLLAERGFLAASIQYFGDDPGVPSALAEVPLSYVQRAIDRLREHERALGDEVGVYGVSKGGELALLAGVHLDGIGAVASVVGSCYVWQGLNRNWQPVDASSWSLDGESVEAIPFPEEFTEHPETIRESYELALEAAAQETVDAATIPVERIDAPTLLVSGGADELWPSSEYATVATDRLRRHDVEASFEHLAYPSAGHLIRPPYVPTFGRSASKHAGFGGTPAGNAEAAAEHWPELLAMYERALGE